MALPKIYFGGQRERSNKQIVILCEGEDDAHFIDKLCAEIGADVERVGIIFSGGESNIENELTMLTKGRSFIDGTTKKIIIIRDSDSDGQKNLSDLSKRLQIKGWSALKNAELVECKIGGSVREIGFFSIPSIDENGALENLVLKSVSEESRYIRAGAVLDDQINDTGELDKYWKRKIQIYLSLYPVRWRGAGMAFKAEVFKANHTCFDDLTGFLKTAVS
jgi:5S rRNA maturation endonuclease (ribonuclease M5)